MRLASKRDESLNRLCGLMKKVLLLHQRRTEWRFFILFLILFHSKYQNISTCFYKLRNDCIFRDLLASAFSHELRCVWTHGDRFQKVSTDIHIHFFFVLPAATSVPSDGNEAFRSYHLTHPI